MFTYNLLLNSVVFKYSCLKHIAWSNLSKRRSEPIFCICSEVRRNLDSAVLSENDVSLEQTLTILDYSLANE